MLWFIRNSRDYEILTNALDAGAHALKLVCRGSSFVAVHCVYCPVLV